MKLSTIQELTDQLKQHDLLLDCEHWDTYEREAQTATRNVRDFALSLCERGFLTNYQVDKLLLGKGHALVLGGYILLEPLGEGGMGQVFKAWQRRLGRHVAVKVIHSHLLGHHEEGIRRFQREARLAAKLLHPNIVAVYDADEVDGKHFIVMEYLQGLDLGRLVKQTGPLPFEQCEKFLYQAANGLQHAFEAGLVHRDIKPSNLLLTHCLRNSGKSRTAQSADAATRVRAPESLIKLLDLGLACSRSGGDGERSLTALTIKGSVLGTPDFMAPEQACDASQVDIRADLYSLGCTFYYLLSGRPPFPSGNAIEKFLKHKSDEPTPLEEIRSGAPAWLVKIIRKLMAKEPDRRFQTPADLLDALDSAEKVQADPRPARARPVRELKPAPYAGESPSIGWRAPSIAHTPLPAAKSVTKRYVVQAHTGCVLSLAFAANGRYLASSGVDNRVCLWQHEGASASLKASLNDVGWSESQALLFSPDAAQLFLGAATLTGVVCSWNWKTSLAAPALVIGKDEQLAIEALAVSANGRRIASASGNNVRLWNNLPKELRRRTLLEGHKNAVKTLRFSPAGRRLASGDERGLIRLWDIGRFWCSESGVLAAHDGPVTALQYAPDGTLLASGGMDGIVRIWPASGLCQTPSHRLCGHGAAIRQMKFLDGGRLLVLSQDGQITLWDWENNRRLQENPCDQSFVVQSAVSADGRHLAAASSDGLITVYDLDLPSGAPEDANSTDVYWHTLSGSVDEIKPLPDNAIHLTQIVPGCADPSSH